MFLGAKSVGTVKDKLLKLMQDVNAVGGSYPLLYIKLDFIEKMELDSNQDRFFKKSLQDIEKLIERALNNIESYSEHVEIKNIYSEAYIFSKLRSLLSISKISEASNKMPDFKVVFRGNNIFIELKAINMVGGSIKHQDVMEGSLDAKIEAEEQLKKGSKVGFGIHEIQPYFSPNKPYDPRSVRLVIESLIDKINNNLDQEQFSQGDTILLVDLSGQLPLISPPDLAIQETYVDDLGKNHVSGELWNVAFGKLDQDIYRPAEFEGASDDDGKLTKEGILLSHPYIKGILFHVGDDFYAVAELCRRNCAVTDLLEYFSKKHTFKSKKGS